MIGTEMIVGISVLAFMWLLLYKRNFSRDSMIHILLPLFLILVGERFISSVTDAIIWFAIITIIILAFKKPLEPLFNRVNKGLDKLARHS